MKTILLLAILLTSCKYEYFKEEELTYSSKDSKVPIELPSKGNPLDTNTMFNYPFHLPPVVVPRKATYIDRVSIIKNEY